MTLDREKEITVHGKTYKLRYPVKSIFQIEKELGHSLLAIVQEFGKEPYISVYFVLLKWGLLGGGQNMSEEEIEDLLEEIGNTDQFMPVGAAMLEAIVASGVFGSPKKVKAAMDHKHKQRKHK